MPNHTFLEAPCIGLGLVCIFSIIVLHRGLNSKILTLNTGMWNIIQYVQGFELCEYILNLNIINIYNILIFNENNHRGWQLDIWF